MHLKRAYVVEFIYDTKKITHLTLIFILKGHVKV